MASRLHDLHVKTCRHAEDDITELRRVLAVGEVADSVNVVRPVCPPGLMDRQNQVDLRKPVEALDLRRSVEAVGSVCRVERLDLGKLVAAVESLNQHDAHDRYDLDDLYDATTSARPITSANQGYVNEYGNLLRHA